MAVRILEPVRAALGSNRIGYANRFAVGLEAKKFSRDEHTGVEALVGDVGEGDEKLGCIGKEDVGSEASAVGRLYEKGGVHFAQALGPNSVLVETFTI